MAIVAHELRPSTHNCADYPRRAGSCAQCLRDRSRAYMAKRRAENRGVKVPETPDEIERFWAKVDKSGTCWIWTGCTNGRGYGTFAVRAVSLLAHRVAYVLKQGEHEEGLELDHLCRNRLCCNPDHLDPVTHTENMRRSPLAYGGEACSRGHVDWVCYPSSPKSRHCRTCNIERKRSERAKRT